MRYTEFANMLRELDLRPAFAALFEAPRPCPGCVPKMAWFGHTVYQHHNTGEMHADLDLPDGFDMPRSLTPAEYAARWNRWAVGSTE